MLAENQDKKENTVMKQNVLLGLKRASWLFAGLVGVITMVVEASHEGWDYPEDYLPLTIVFTVIGFLLFRVAIWVVKAFLASDNADSER